MVAKTPPGPPKTRPESAREVPEDGSSKFSAPRCTRDHDIIPKTLTKTRKWRQKTSSKPPKPTQKPPPSHQNDAKNDHQNPNSMLPSCSEDCTRDKRFGTHYPHFWVELLSSSAALPLPFGGARSLSLSLLFRRARCRHASWNKLPWSMCSAPVFVCVSVSIVPKRTLTTRIKEQAFDF